MSNSGIFGTTSPVNTTELQAKYAQQTTKIKERFDSLGVAYSGLEQTGGLVSLSPASTADKYFYHPDHLGSSSLITDGNGHLVQHIQYVPFGEVFIEQRNSKWSTPYKFNGKELDEETGLAYYHARYYDPRTSVWLSVDPLAEKYPAMNSYNYCANNPIIYIDPDGKEFELKFESNLAKNAFVKTMNAQLEGQFEVSLNETKNGTYMLDFKATKNGGNLSKMTDKGQEFYNEMKKGIDNKSVLAQINIVYGKSDVHTGNYIKQSIDIADVNQFSFARGLGATQAGKIVHEFVEQFEKAKIYKKNPGVFKADALYGYTNCHLIAILSENIVNNNRRDVNEKGAVQIFHEKNGSTSRVTVGINRSIVTVNQTNSKR